MISDFQVFAIGVLSLILTGPPSADPQISVDGLVRLIEQVDVPALREGRIDKINLKEGAYVRHGDLLGSLDATEAKLTLKRTELEHQLAVEKAQSEIAINSAKLIQEVTRNEFLRAVQAKKTAPGSISLTEFDRLKLESEKAANELTRLIEERGFAALNRETKAVELQLAQLALDERKLISPLDGMIVQVYRHQGEWVHMGDKVVRIVRIDRLRVEAYVNLNSALASLENAPVTFEVTFPDSDPQVFKGEVVFLNPEADPVNGQIRIWAEIENRDRLLRPGHRGRIRIQPKTKAAISTSGTTPP